jgi:tetratricopeptide (TPR) repeat protein
MRPFVVPLLACSLLFFALSAAARSQSVQLNPNPQTYDAGPSDPAAAIAHARDRVASGDLEGAIIYLQSYLAGHPHEPDPERLLGDLYYRKGELDRAEATYKDILLYYPKDKETHNRLGSVYATENRINDAIAEFNRSLPGTDSVPDLVRLHMRNGTFDSYKQQLEENADANADDAEAQSEIGELYETIDSPGLAERYFKRALLLAPDSVIALNGMALSYQDQGNYADAIKEYQKCLQEDSGNYACMSNLGSTYLQTSQLAMAQKWLEQAHRLAPERAEAIVNLGYLADDRNDWHKAVSEYVEAIVVYPYLADAYLDLGDTYYEHRYYKLAQQALIKGLAVAPEDGRLHFLLGDTYASEGNDPLAMQEYRAAAAGQFLADDYKREARERVAALERNTPASTPTPPHL